MTTTDRVAAAVLARAIADAVNPDRPAATAALGNALMWPVAEKAVAVLSAAGYHIVRDPDYEATRAVLRIVA